jgi:23S rRNA (guanine2445-N2)-methyltransferase / 23S rRNA (guanine2069-N7)-methyltransferase
LRVKDALVDRLRERLGVRPSVDAQTPDLQIHVYVHQDQAQVSLDLSGISLHRRGYRVLGSAAPLKENLAAAILMRAGWPEAAATGGALLDPMCGSGTLVIEGALIACDIAPGLLRERFGFLHWKQHDDRAWRRLRDEAQERRLRGLDRTGRFRGYDQDPHAIRVALDDAARAGLSGVVHFERRELAQARPGRNEDRGLVVINPPYGERLGSDADLSSLYARLGSILRERFLGWSAAVFTGRPDLGKRMGLRAHRIHHLYNGPIACELIHLRVEPAAFVTGRPPPLPSEKRGEGATMLANRIAKNLKGLAKWRRSQGIDCFRAYDADLPEYAVAIDVYTGPADPPASGDARWIHVQEYAAPATVDPKRAHHRLREALTVIPELFEVPEHHVFLKVRQPQRGLAQYEKVAETGRFRTVREGGLRFLINLEDYLDTGLFLDHRDIRAMLRDQAEGRRVLNLFAYTGTATVYAAQGGASETTSVDLSKTYVAWARRNLLANGVDLNRHELIQADCLRWVDEQVGKRRYDLIFLDPPSFSSSKRMNETLDIQRDHVRLIRSVVRLLERDGLLVFSNNRQRFRMEVDALAQDLRLEDISLETIPRDFARTPRIHQCWLIHRGR